MKKLLSATVELSAVVGCLLVPLSLPTAAQTQVRPHCVRFTQTVVEAQVIQQCVQYAPSRATIVPLQVTKPKRYDPSYRPQYHPQPMNRRAPF
jgi:hypothetical protein